MYAIQEWMLFKALALAVVVAGFLLVVVLDRGLEWTRIRRQVRLEVHDEAGSRPVATQLQ